MDEGAIADRLLALSFHVAMPEVFVNVDASEASNQRLILLFENPAGKYWALTDTQAIALAKNRIRIRVLIFVSVFFFIIEERIQCYYSGKYCSG